MSNSLAFRLFLLVPMLVGAGRAAQFEQKDIVGSTNHFNLTVGTTAVAIPTVGDKAIAEVLVRCPTQTGSKTCLVSFEAAIGPFVTLTEGEFIIWSLKGYLKQFWVKAAGAGTNVETVVNFEP